MTVPNGATPANMSMITSPSATSPAILDLSVDSLGLKYTLAGSVYNLTPNSLWTVSETPSPAMHSRSLIRKSPFTPESMKTVRRLRFTRRSASPIAPAWGRSSSGSLIIATSPTTSNELGRRGDSSSGTSATSR